MTLLSNGADGKGKGDRPVQADAHELGRAHILRDRAHGLAELGADGLHLLDELRVNHLRRASARAGELVPLEIRGNFRVVVRLKGNYAHSHRLLYQSV